MINAIKMKEKLQTLKNEAQNLIDINKLDEAEIKNSEIKILNAQIEIQEKLDDANEKISNFENDITNKDAKISELTTEIKTVNTENLDLKDKATNATNTITDLNEKVNKMQPIIDEYNKKMHEEKLNGVQEEYKAKFENVGGLEEFESEEIQSLIKDVVNEDETISKDAKYNLSEKIMDIFDKNKTSAISISNIQEPTIQNKNLNKEADEFKSVYGFEKQ